MFNRAGFQSPKSLDGTFENQVEEDPVVVLPASQVRISAYDNNNSTKEGDSSEKVKKCQCHKNICLTITSVVPKLFWCAEHFNYLSSPRNTRKIDL